MFTSIRIWIGPKTAVLCSEWENPEDLYVSVVASAIHYAVVAWISSITVAERKKLVEVEERAGSVLGCSLDLVEVVGDRRMVVKLSSVLSCPPTT